MKTLIKSLLISFIGLGIVGCSDSVMDANSFEVASSKSANNSAPTPNIVTVASELDDFSILVDAVVFADLAGTLSGRGQYTVFAPTNTAFESLLQTLNLTPEQLFVEANRELVTEILLYHVAPGRRTSMTLGRQVNMVNGDKAVISFQDTPEIENGRTFIDSAEIVGPDVTTFEGARISNGVIHVIDTVILPPSIEAALGISQ